ncbi:MAG: orotidine 5'-phosphate decarboxylase, partial [Thermoplasmata archaeon]
MGFIEKLNRAVSKNDSLLCVGLDVDRDKIPKDLREKPDGIIKFNERVITNTCDFVCCYKLNLAFYEA